MKKFNATYLSLFISVLFFSSVPLSNWASSPLLTEESPAANDAYSYVKKYMEGFKNGNFVIGSTTTDGVKALIGPNTDSDGVITVGKTFTGFSFDAEWSFEEGSLANFSCYTFYDVDKQSEAEKDGEEIFGLMKKIFGDPIVITEDFYDWEVGEMLVSCDLFEDGYSIYVDPIGDEESDITCVGDFYNLKLDLQEVFIANMKNGKIKIGSTTKEQMEAITGSGEAYYKEYDGLWASGDYVYDESGKLSALTIDYFYDCSGALILLDMDKGDITTIINESVGADGFKDTNDVDATIRWNVNGQSLRQEGYEDGYAILFGQ